MKLIISFILIIILICFYYSSKNEEKFQATPTNNINFEKGSHIVFQKNLFYKTGDKTKELLETKFNDKIDLDKNNLFLDSGFRVKKKLCIDNVCINPNNLKQFIEPNVVPKFYKKCNNYKRNLKSNESPNTDTSWKDKNNRGCAYYEHNPYQRCKTSDDTMPGPESAFNGIGAKDACCICKSSTDITDKDDLINNKLYTEINYSHDSKQTKPDYLCMNDDEYIIFYANRIPLRSSHDMVQLKKERNTLNDRPHWKNTSLGVHLKYDNNKWALYNQNDIIFSSEDTDLKIPNKVDYESGKNWGDIK